MQPVENEPLETDSPLIRHCLALGRLRGFTPVPLGERRQRFMALVNDMRRYGADYTSQLSMLTLAGLNQGDQGESSPAMIADLLHRSDIQEKEEEHLRLWQARLILKLGEWYDRQQADIDAVLERIATRQDALLQELREEDDNPFALTAGIAEHSPEDATLLRHRLKAWSQLCLHDQGQPPGIPVTRHAMTMDLLQEVFEQRHHAAPWTLAGLDLPSSPEDDAVPPVLIGQFPALHQAIGRLQQPLAAEEATAVMQQVADQQTAWHQAVETRFPSASVDRCQLELIYFPEISIRQLFLEGFAGGGIGSGIERQDTPKIGCCIGLLKKP